MRATVLLDRRNPRKTWIGWYEGGQGKGSDGKWTLGFATSKTSDPLGDWQKWPHNPIMRPEEPCDPTRSFDNSTCNGLYVGSVLHDEIATAGEYWLYAEGPINQNDEVSTFVFPFDKY